MRAHVSKLLAYVANKNKISAKIKTLRKEFAMCKDVYDRSASVERTVTLIEFPQLLEQEKQKSAPKKDGREGR